MKTAPTARRAASTLLCASAVAVVAAACSSGGTASTGASASASSSTTTAATTPATTTTTSAPATTSASTTTTTSSAPVTTAQIPAGAGTATTVDLDGDGKPDTVWLADVGGKRELGVATTSHGGTSIEYSSAAPQSATASAAVLASGAPTVFLDTGRSVQLYVYRVESSALVPVNGVTGGQYSFSLGFTDYGTGLACTTASDGLHLFGENATSDASGNSWTVKRTEVTVSAEHSVAQNGATTTVGTGLKRDDPAVTAAHGTTCGDVAASGIAKEPM